MHELSQVEIEAVSGGFIKNALYTAGYELVKAAGSYLLKNDGGEGFKNGDATIVANVYGA
ncbi:putative Electron transport complex subunit C [Stenotrophomonas geniculata]|uniref:hypothetical protein n=1 Tax=Stenotrophomonas geniculata TaxID=86188 RepID=UPI00374C686C